MEEYEYSFKVLSIKPYIDYCEENNYKKIEITKQNRIIYENKHVDHIIARITIEIKNGKEVITFDCKNVGEAKGELKISKESLVMEVPRNDKEKIESMLEVLDFKEVVNLNRTRYIYEKENVKFELDSYIDPKMNVVALEGNRNEVDIVYEELKKLKLDKK